MALPSTLLLGTQKCATGLPPVPMTRAQVADLHELARRPDRRTISVEMLPEWFVKMMASKNPIQPLAIEIPFKLSGFTKFGVLEPKYRKDHDKKITKILLSKGLSTIAVNRHAKTEVVETVKRKMAEKQPLTPEESAFVDSTGKNVISMQERRDYSDAEKQKVAEITAAVPRSAREMRVEVERLCKKYRYSPIEALVQIAVNPPKDDNGNPTIRLSDLIDIHKMLLPYTAPTMSSVRVSDQSGGSLVVRINQFNFVPHGPDKALPAPVADDKNNDIGDSWRTTAGRKTALELIQVRPNGVSGGMTETVRKADCSVVVPVPEYPARPLVSVLPDPVDAAPN